MGNFPHIFRIGYTCKTLHVTRKFIKAATLANISVIFDPENVTGFKFNQFNLHFKNSLARYWYLCSEVNMKIGKFHQLDELIILDLVTAFIQGRIFKFAVFF